MVESITQYIPEPLAKTLVCMKLSVPCSDAGFHDRVVIQELLKEVAQSHTLESSQRDFKGQGVGTHADET